MSLNNEEIKKIKAIMVFEIIGRPKEYLTESLDKIIIQISEEKGVKINEKKLNEPILIKTNSDSSEKIQSEQKDFYTSFAELEIEIEEIFDFVMLVFKYMPAHIEIISPEKIVLSNNSWNEVLNEITRRLHGYDEIARVIQIEKNILEKKLEEVLGDKEGKGED